MVFVLKILRFGVTAFSLIPTCPEGLRERGREREREGEGRGRTLYFQLLLVVIL